MIAQKLLKIKSFGSDRKSAVTEGDMAQKEAELGFPLPAALRELYLCHVLLCDSAFPVAAK